MSNKMTDAEQARAVKLAKDGHRIEHIAARLGYTYARMWRYLARVQERGDLPPGTVERLGNGTKKTASACSRPHADEDPPPKVSVYAPAGRAAAAFMGRCNGRGCTETTDVVIEVNGATIRLCRHDAGIVRDGIDRAIKVAQAQRVKFTGSAV